MSIDNDNFSFLTDSVTRDELKRFGLVLFQPANGYRFTLDPLLLSDFSCASNELHIADLGTGSGVMALILSKMAAGSKITAIEKYRETALLASENVRLNGLGERIIILNEDITDVKKHLTVSSYDLVVSNPPYLKRGIGKLNPHYGKLLSRHETTATLSDFLAAAKYLVKPTGRICMVYHPDRLTDLITEAAEQKLAVTRLRFVHGIPAAAAKVFLVELFKGRKQANLQILPPLIVRSDGENYTDEVRKILTGR